MRRKQDIAMFIAAVIIVAATFLWTALYTLGLQGYF